MTLRSCLVALSLSLASFASFTAFAGPLDQAAPPAVPVMLSSAPLSVMPSPTLGRPEARGEHRAEQRAERAEQRAERFEQRAERERREAMQATLASLRARLDVLEAQLRQAIGSGQVRPEAMPRFRRERAQLERSLQQAQRSGRFEQREQRNCEQRVQGLGNYQAQFATRAPRANGHAH